jgi:hypothetical protein
MVYYIDNNVPELVEADHRLITQILVNLLSNALKFTDSGFVEVHVSLVDVRLKIDVKDTGSFRSLVMVFWLILNRMNPMQVVVFLRKRSVCYSESSVS